MRTAAASLERSGESRARSRKSPFFTLLGIIMLALAIAGFWPQYFSAILGRPLGGNAQFWMIHLHAALFLLWLLAYTSQAALVLTGRTRAHRKLGPWIAGYGFAIALVGLYAGGLLFHRFAVLENDFETAAAIVFFPLVDMVYFAGFLAAGAVWRNRPVLHKRAMFLATFSMAIVGAGRLVDRMGVESEIAWQALILAPLLLALAYDAVVWRKLYAVMAVGLVLHLARLSADPFTASEAWLPAGRAVLRMFG
jgi:hypothetical protein